MDGFLPEIDLQVLGALLAAAVLGWLIRSPFGRSRIRQLNNEWQQRLDDVADQRDVLAAETEKLRTSVDAQEAVIRQRDMAIAKMQTELESAHDREKLMTNNILTLRAEREGFKTKVVGFQNALISLRQQSADLQIEFVKSGEFYKAQLAKSFAQRKVLEDTIENTRAEHESFNELLQASRTEHQSVNKMLAAARDQLEKLDLFEKKTIELEAENAQLNHDSAIARRENDALKRDATEQDDFKIQNHDLTQVLKSMEDSRKQCESDANRYRRHAGKSEKKSETLRIRLDEVEKNFREIEEQQRRALQDARGPATIAAANDDSSAAQDLDDLREIIGIGKVFEHTLHQLGVTSFRQIANFGVADIARVNAELKEFKGRMEQDNWIGQARNLHIKKYG